MDESSTGGGLAQAKKAPEVPKVGETIKLVFDRYGHLSRFNDVGSINPSQRLIEVEVKSVKKVKVEFEEEE